MHKKSMFLFLLLIFKSVISAELSNSDTAAHHTITVFVHGTSIARRMMNISPYRPNLYCPQGLTLAKDLPLEYRYHQIAKSCAEINHQLNDFMDDGLQVAIIIFLATAFPITEVCT